MVIRKAVWFRAALLVVVLAPIGAPLSSWAVAPTGACCSAGVCTETLEFACDGSFIGVGTTCAEVSCASPAPVLSTAGLIALIVFLMGFVAFRFHRRARADSPGRQAGLR